MTTFERMVRELNKLEAAGKVMTPDPETPIVPDAGALLTFAVWGDPQIASWSPLRSARLLAALRDLDNCPLPLDALLFVGDIAENGALAEYQMTAKLLREHSRGFRKFLCVSGNHDVRLRDYGAQLARFSRFIGAVPGGVVPDSAMHYYGKTQVNGYTFLLMGTDRATFEGAYISRAQQHWLDRELAAAPSDRPVFVVNHQTLPGVNGLPHTWLGKGDWRGTVGWESDAVRAILEKHRNAVFLTGHLHYGVSEYTYEDCGTFHALSVPTVGVVNHGDFTPDTQGYVVSVYSDRIVARARIFGEGRYVPEDVPGAYVVMRWTDN